MCAKYSDFLCIWLRKCDFLTGKVRYWPDPDLKLFIPDPDPAKSSGSGSTTLEKSVHVRQLFPCTIDGGRRKNEKVIVIHASFLTGQRNVLCAVEGEDESTYLGKKGAVAIGSLVQGLLGENKGPGHKLPWLQIPLDPSHQHHNHTQQQPWWWFQPLSFHRSRIGITT